MRQITEIEYVYDPHGVVLYRYKGMVTWLYGLTGMFYQAMVKYFGKDEADQTFYEIYFDKKSSGLSPDTAAVTMEPAQAQ